MRIFRKALERGQSVLSEYESKKVLAEYDIPVTQEFLVNSGEEALSAANQIGYPIVLKGCSPELTHKTEHNLIALNIRDEPKLLDAYQRIIDRGTPMEGVIVQEMIDGERELIVGLKKDPQFGPCVMFGLGGVFTEVIKDISLRIAPLQKRDALEMIKEIKGYRLLEGYRDNKPANIDSLISILVNLGKLGLNWAIIKEVDLNPVIISDGDGEPIAVDALIVLG